VNVEDGLAGVVDVEEVAVAGFAGVVVVAVVAAAFGAVAHAVRVEVDEMLRSAIRYADGAALDDDDDAERRAEKLLRADVVAMLIALVVRVCVKMEMRYLAANAKSRFLTLGLLANQDRSLGAYTAPAETTFTRHLFQLYPYSSRRQVIHLDTRYSVAWSTIKTDEIQRHPACLASWLQPHSGPGLVEHRARRCACVQTGPDTRL
jgi:hypothetical protein